MNAWRPRNTRDKHMKIASDSQSEPELTVGLVERVLNTARQCRLTEPPAIAALTDAECHREEVMRDLRVVHQKPMNDFDREVDASTGKVLNALTLETIQVNVGLKCNMACVHCHVSSSPLRTETMDWPVMEMILKAARATSCSLIDITGGAPELNPHLRRFIEAARGQGHSVQVRTNLTVLLEPGFETMPEFFRDNQVHLVASLPCYLEDNVRAQRGAGTYEKSIQD